MAATTVDATELLEALAELVDVADEGDQEMANVSGLRVDSAKEAGWLVERDVALLTVLRPDGPSSQYLVTVQEVR